MTYNEVTIPVEYDGIPGGIFEECIPVVVHGTIEQGVLYGDNIEVKHSDEYVAENDEYGEAQDAGCPPTA
jgi:cytochrome c-type biogenesis protein CcmE